MNDPELTSSQMQALTKVQNLFDALVGAAEPDLLIGIYHDIIMIIWNQIMPTLGATAVVAIVERSLDLTADEYPQLEVLSVDPDGVSLQHLSPPVDPAEQERLCSAMKTFITHITELLAALTGTIIVRQVINELEARSAC